MGVDESHTRYHMNKIEDPAAAAARAAECAGMATEFAAAEAARVPAKFIFVERAGAQPASAGVEAAIGIIESQIGVRVKSVAKHPREEASIVLLSELEDEAERREALETELGELKLCDATQRLELRASTARIAVLEAKLASTSSSAATAAVTAQATVGAAKGGAERGRRRVLREGWLGCRAPRGPRDFRRALLQQHMPTACPRHSSKLY